MTASRFDVRELDYALPDERIAQAPLAERDAARLLCLGPDGAITHRSVRELPGLLRPSLIVVNDTRVIPARLFGRKPSGGRVELLLYERLSPPGARERWLALGRASKGLRAGERVALGAAGDTENAAGAMSAQVIALRERAVEIELSAEPDVSTALARIGHVPLPPYIRRAPDASDAERYQTVFAAHDGAVAAPTAGLHLSAALLAALRARGHELAFVTLHVGPGTFAPLRGDDLAGHVMHPERYAVPEATAGAIARARASGRQVLAVGTTVVRALEAAGLPDGTVQSGAGATALFIYPPYRFRVVDAVMTNFHLPRSTLLALVMAFGGIEPVRNAYRTAVECGYRFYSYGDAMLIGGSA